MNEQVAERTNFFKEWVRAPRVTASILPSSRSLAASMVRDVVATSAPVVELGPGTGVLTRALLQRGIDEADLVLVEVNSFFAASLARKFPRARVVHASAEALDSVPFERMPQFVVSGLPFLSMPNEQVGEIVRAAFAVLDTGGRIIQFTYAPRCPVNRTLRDRYGLYTSLERVVWRNVPPAAVYHIGRFADRHAGS